MRRLIWTFILISPLLAYVQTYGWSLHRATLSAETLITQTSDVAVNAVQNLFATHTSSLTQPRHFG